MENKAIYQNGIQFYLQPSHTIILLMIIIKTG